MYRVMERHNKVVNISGKWYQIISDTLPDDSDLEKVLFGEYGVDVQMYAATCLQLGLRPCLSTSETGWKRIGVNGMEGGNLHPCWVGKQIWSGPYYQARGSVQWLSIINFNSSAIKVNDGYLPKELLAYITENYSEVKSNE